MSDENEKKSGKKGYEWIKSDKSGVSYLCPVGSIQNKDGASEEDLKKVCVDESMNPQND